MKPPHAHVSLVTLGASDVTGLARFYEALGFVRKLRGAPSDVAFFEAGGIALSIYALDGFARDAGIGLSTQTPGKGAISLAWNCESEAGVDAVMAAAIGAGGSCLVPAKRAAWGGYHGHFADPEGHLWEVACNPQFPLSPEGRPTLPD